MQDIDLNKSRYIFAEEKEEGAMEGALHYINRTIDWEPRIPHGLHTHIWVAWTHHRLPQNQRLIGDSPLTMGYVEPTHTDPGICSTMASLGRPRPPCLACYPLFSSSGSSTNDRQLTSTPRLTRHSSADRLDNNLGIKTAHEGTKRCS